VLLSPPLLLRMQDLQAMLQQELQLHSKIYDTIWAAVYAMECWTAGVSRWQCRVIQHTNTWLAHNAALIAKQAGPGAPGTSFSPVPIPAAVDLSQSLRPQQQKQQQQENAVHAATGEYGAAVVIKAGQPRSGAGPYSEATGAVVPADTGTAGSGTQSMAGGGEAMEVQPGFRMARWAGLQTISDDSCGF
jgi:hypothetical protein